PFLEGTTGIGPQGLSLMLLGFGVANFVGTLVAGWMLTRHPLATLVLMPALVGVAALALVLLPASVPGQAVLLAVWGLAFGGVPVAW
ncbi:MFS transporter, partial [Pseudomonas sp. SIMBA_059]